jgi:outer membrane protein OmpA-like peptidoglycan-associated protein
VNLALGTASFLSLGAQLPFYYVRMRPLEDYGEVAGLPKLDSQFYLGDVKAELKIRALKMEDYWLGLAIAPYATFPTGDKESLLSDARVTGGGTLILEHDFGPLDIALNGGYHYRGKGEVLTVDVGDAITYGAGISHDWDNGVGFSIEYWGATYSIADTNILTDNPMEVTASLRWKFGKNGPRLIAYGGPGVGNGVGAPVYRIGGGIDYYCRECEPAPGKLTVLTVDQDGKPLAAKLAITPGDKAASTNSDGSWEGEFKDGAYKVSASRDGYSPASADASLKTGGSTTVKLVLKELEKPKAKPAVLELTVVDKCTNAKLTGTAVAAAKSGAKETIAIQDGKGAKELAPGDYEVTLSIAGYQPKTVQATVAKEATVSLALAAIPVIDVKGRIFFAVNSDKILAKSNAALDEAAAKIKKLCDYKKITIGGHTSSEGGDKINVPLAQKRAQAVVNYLVKKGIDPNKLEAKGFASTQPIATNDNEAGRSENRRVEIVVVD